MPDPIIIAIAKWLYDTYATGFLKKALGWLGAESLNRIKWEKATKRYKENLHGHMNSTRIFSKPGKNPLKELFAGVNILVDPSARSDQDKMDQREGLSVVNEFPKLFVLGEPGAGKTTFLHYIALQTIEEQPVKKLPIFISLNELSLSGKPVLDYIVERFRVYGFPDAQPFVTRLLKDGNGIVLFDGLDEVKTEDRESSINQLNGFIDEFGACQIIISCRVGALDYVFEQMKYVRIAPFNDKQIRDYVRKWFVQPEQREKRHACLQALDKQENQTLLEMARTPLVLSLLCQVFDSQGRFPKSRVKLYERVLEDLLVEWDEAKGIERNKIHSELTLKQEQQLFAFIAYHAFDQGKAKWEKKELLNRINEYLASTPTTKEVDARTVLKEIEVRHSVLVRQGQDAFAQDVYTFVHLTFQEYYTALYFVEAIKQDGLLTEVQSPLPGQSRLSSLMTHVCDPRWGEVLLIVAEMLPKAASNLFFALFLEALQQVVGNEEPLKSILKWADLRSNKAIETKLAFPSLREQPLNPKPAALRSLYLHLFLEMDSQSHQAGYDFFTYLIHERSSNYAFIIGYSFTLELDNFDDDVVSRFEKFFAPAMNLYLKEENIKNRTLATLFLLSSVLKSNLWRDMSLPLEAYSRFAEHFFASALLHPLLAYDYLLNMMSLVLDILKQVPEPQFKQLLAGSAKSKLMECLSRMVVFGGIIGLPEYQFEPLFNAANPRYASFDAGWYSTLAQVIESTRKYQDLIHHWKLSNEQVTRLNSYLKANWLLIECLNVADIDDRETIENQILLPNPIIHRRESGRTNRAAEGLKADDKGLISMISILFLAADPTDASHLRLGQEFREIQEKLKLAKLRDRFRLELPQLSVRPADISQALLDVQPQIVHFSGHGASTGALCFENQAGQTHLVQPDALAALFEQFANQVNCVLLNACYSELQAKAIAEHIEYVIGMNQAIGDTAAIAFAVGFYQALGAGRTIEDAYKLGCVQIRLQGIPEHLTPVLVKKEQIQSSNKAESVREQLLKLEKKIERLLTNYPDIRNLDLDHPDSQQWRTTTHLYLQEVDQVLGNSNLAERYIYIAWHRPDQAADDSEEQKALYVRGLR